MKTLFQKHPLPTYFCLAFTITWIGSLIYYFSTHKPVAAFPSFFSFPGVIIWFYGPASAAYLVTRLSEGKAGVRSLLNKFRLWRVGWFWYAFIILYPLALHLFVVSMDWLLLNGAKPLFFQAAGVPQGNPLLILAGVMLSNTLLNGIGEETGWRGFALPRLQSRLGAFRASLVLGFFWALWHLHPANFSSLLSLAGIFHFFTVWITAFLFTQVNNRTRGSLLIALLFHMTLNVAEFLVPIGIAQVSLSRSILHIAFVSVATAIFWLLPIQKTIPLPGSKT